MHYHLAYIVVDAQYHMVNQHAAEAARRGRRSVRNCLCYIDSSLTVLWICNRKELSMTRRYNTRVTFHTKDIYICIYILQQKYLYIDGVNSRRCACKLDGVGCSLIIYWRFLVPCQSFGRTVDYRTVMVYIMCGGSGVCKQFTAT